MDSMIDALYEYAQEQCIQGYLETWDYRRATYCLEEDWAAFRSTLTAEQNLQLNVLLENEQTAGRLEEKAAFRCALSLGIGLGRL